MMSSVGLRLRVHRILHKQGLQARTDWDPVWSVFKVLTNTLRKEAIPVPLSHDISEAAGVSHCFPLLLMRQGKFIQEQTISAFTSAVKFRCLKETHSSKVRRCSHFLTCLVFCKVLMPAARPSSEWDVSWSSGHTLPLV